MFSKLSSKLLPKKRTDDDSDDDYKRMNNEDVEAVIYDVEQKLPKFVPDLPETEYENAMQYLRSQIGSINLNGTPEEITKAA